MGNPGKFEGCADQGLAERLYSLTLDGFCDGSGDVDGFGLWFGAVDLDGRWFILTEDNYGFVDYIEYSGESERDAAYDEQEREYCDWLDANDVND